MTPRYIPPTIQQKGLRVHLDETAKKHNGRGYDDFIRYLTTVNEFGKPYKRQDIVDAFGITWMTLYKWLEAYKQEKGQGNEKTNS